MKHIVYKYDDDRSNDVDFDARGSLIFTEGDIISRHGTSWKVALVEQELSLETFLLIPTYWVHLARVVVN